MTRLPLFFDLDGTVLDVSARHYRVYDRLTRAFGGVPLGTEDYWRLKHEKLPWPQILARSSVPPGRSGTYLAAFITEIEKPRELALDKCVPGAHGTLRRLHADGHPMYLVSLRRSHAGYVRQLTELGLTQYFSEILSGWTDGRADELKAHLIEQRACGAGGVTIGDTEADVLAGKRLGMVTVAVTGGLRGRRYLQALLPDYLLDSVAGLPGIMDRFG